MKQSRKAYPARSRAEVEALCPAPVKEAYDGRLDKTPHHSGTRQKLTTTAYSHVGRPITEAQNQKRKTREHSALERTFKRDMRAFSMGTVVYFERDKAIKRYTGSGK